MSIRDEAMREAERRWPLHWERDLHSRIGTAPRVAFMSGAEWQASREPTEEEVWRAARAAFIADGFTGESWDADPHEGYVDMARAALRAARRDEEKRDG